MYCFSNIMLDSLNKFCCLVKLFYFSSCWSCFASLIITKDFLFKDICSFHCNLSGWILCLIDMCNPRSDVDDIDPCNISNRAKNQRGTHGNATHLQSTCMALDSLKFDVFSLSAETILFKIVIIALKYRRMVWKNVSGMKWGFERFQNLLKTVIWYKTVQQRCSVIAHLTHRHHPCGQRRVLPARIFTRRSSTDKPPLLLNEQR